MEANIDKGCKDTGYIPSVSFRCQEGHGRHYCLFPGASIGHALTTTRAIAGLIRGSLASLDPNCLGAERRGLPL